MCPRCGEKTWSVDRSIHSDATIKRQTYHARDLKRAHGLVGHYTEDFVVRRRTCSRCGNREVFVELPMADLEEILRLKDGE